MIDEQVADELVLGLAEMTDGRLATVFLANVLACAVTGGKDAKTGWARLHKALLQEIKRRGLVINNRLN